MENINLMTAIFQSKIEETIMQSNLPVMVVELVLQNMLHAVNRETQKAVQNEQQQEQQNMNKQQE